MNYLKFITTTFSSGPVKAARYFLSLSEPTAGHNDSTPVASVGLRMVLSLTVARMFNANGADVKDNSKVAVNRRPPLSLAQVYGANGANVDNDPKVAANGRPPKLPPKMKPKLTKTKQRINLLK